MVTKPKRFLELDQNQNLQLESLYLHEADARVKAWKRRQDEIAEQHREWPPPLDGKTYNKREEAIYSVNTNNHNYNSWFQRHIYRNELMKATQRRCMTYDSNKSSSSRETKLEKKVNQLKENLQSSQVNDNNHFCLKPMYPVIPSVRYILYNGTSKEHEGRFAYLNKRKIDAPDEKYCHPLCSSWDITWNWNENNRQSESSPETVCKRTL